MKSKGKIRKLFSKIIIVYSSIFIISFTVISIVLSFVYKNLYFESKNQEIKNTSLIVNSMVNQYYAGIISENVVRDSLTKVAKNSNYKMGLVDSLGRIYMTSNNDENFIGHTINMDDMNNLKSGSIINTADGILGFVEFKNYTYIAPIEENGEFLGAVVIVEENGGFNKSFMNFLLITTIVSIITALFGAIAFYLFTRNRIVKPIINMNEAYTKIIQGEYSKRVEVQGLKEIEELARSFNSMAESLERIDVNSKEFLSNVSHELRSPMTSIKGFIGGVLDGVIPEDKTRHYLQIAYDEVERLSRLTNELLELSTLEADNVRLKKESFDLITLIKAEVDYFEPLLIKKKLSVQVTYDQEKLYVYSDKDRIIQVVINLIDNAVKYSKEGSQIKIDLKSDRYRAFVSIFNSGSRISDENLKKIWERFYKEDKSRTTKESTGLGLSIVRNILTCLDEEIIVENIKDDGVRFTFTLKRLYLEE